MASGGYRRPTNPAPVSGPGRLSHRTDGGPGQKLMAPSGMEYGDRQGLLDQERTAPLSQANNLPSVHAPRSPVTTPDAGGMTPRVTPFSAPSGRPHEPVTTGVDIGPGAGSSAMPLPPPQMQQQGTGAMANMLRGMSAFGTSGDLASLYQAALTRGV